MPLVTNTMRIYWDYNSTTPCAAEVVADMLPYFSDAYGNPSSPHGAGRLASLAVAEAREEIATAIGAQSDNVIFTSCATESNNLVLLGVSRNSNGRRKIVASAIEHKSVLGPAQQLANEGYILETIPVDHNGTIDLQAAARVIDEHTLLVSVQGANNETGVIQPIREIANLAHNRGALYHCDLSLIHI